MSSCSSSSLSDSCGYSNFCTGECSVPRPAQLCSNPPGRSSWRPEGSLDEGIVKSSDICGIPQQRQCKVALIINESQPLVMWRPLQTRSKVLATTTALLLRSKTSQEVVLTVCCRLAVPNNVRHKYTKNIYKREETWVSSSIQEHELESCSSGAARSAVQLFTPATAVLSVYLPYALRAHCNVARLGSHNTGKNNKLPIDANEFKVYQQ